MKLSSTQMQGLKNQETFAELTDIEDVRPEDLFVTHDKYAFDVNELSEWLATKKEFINPYTNDELPVRDIDTYCIQVAESVAGHLQRAFDALDAGDWSLALRAGKAALKLQPSNQVAITFLKGLGESVEEPSTSRSAGTHGPLQLEPPATPSRHGTHSQSRTGFPPPPAGWRIPSAARPCGLSHAVWFALHQLAETMTQDLTEDHSGAHQALRQWTRTLGTSGGRHGQERVDQHIKIFDLSFSEQARCALNGRANSAHRRVGIMDFGHQLAARLRQLGFTVQSSSD